MVSPGRMKPPLTMIRSDRSHGRWWPSRSGTRSRRQPLLAVAETWFMAAGSSTCRRPPSFGNRCTILMLPLSSSPKRPTVWVTVTVWNERTSNGPTASTRAAAVLARRAAGMHRRPDVAHVVVVDQPVRHVPLRQGAVSQGAVSRSPPGEARPGTRRPSGRPAGPAPHPGPDPDLAGGGVGLDRGGRVGVLDGLGDRPDAAAAGHVGDVEVETSHSPAVSMRGQSAACRRGKVKSKTSRPAP